MHMPDDSKQDKPLIVCIIPFALPGSGKSFCFKAIQKKISETEGWSFDIVSSDGIRGELMRKAIENDPNLTKD